MVVPILGTVAERGGQRGDPELAPFAANWGGAPSGVTRRQLALAGPGLWSRARRLLDPGAGL